MQRELAGQHLPGQAREVGQQAESTHASLLAQHVWWQVRGSGQHEPFRQVWLPVQHALPHRLLGAQQTPLWQSSPSPQQALSQARSGAQQALPRQTWLPGQQITPQSRDFGQQALSMQASPGAQHPPPQKTPSAQRQTPSMQGSEPWQEPQEPPQPLSPHIFPVHFGLQRLRFLPGFLSSSFLSLPELLRFFRFLAAPSLAASGTPAAASSRAAVRPRPRRERRLPSVRTNPSNAFASTRGTLSEFGGTRKSHPGRDREDRPPCLCDRALFRHEEGPSNVRGGALQP